VEGGWKSLQGTGGGNVSPWLSVGRDLEYRAHARTHARAHTHKPTSRHLHYIYILRYHIYEYVYT